MSPPRSASLPKTSFASAIVFIILGPDEQTAFFDVGVMNRKTIVVYSGTVAIDCGFTGRQCTVEKIGVMRLYFLVLVRIPVAPS